MESIRALRRPYVSIIPADASDPMGVAKECIDAMREWEIGRKRERVGKCLKKCEKGQQCL